MQDYLKAINRIKVNKKGSVISLHKPLLLLLAIAELMNRRENHFLYREMEGSMRMLLAKYGLKNTKKLNPFFPFFHLSSDPLLWQCSVDKCRVNLSGSVSRSLMLEASAQFPAEFFDFLSVTGNAESVVTALLKNFWPEAYHDDILTDLGIEDLIGKSQAMKAERQRRGRQFVEEVLDCYERKCAICEQSVRLGDALMGIDACHVKPIQHFGEDVVNNGIALCKLHHWAFDRGAISISKEMELLVSPKLNGSRIEMYYHEYSGKPLFVPRNPSAVLLEENVQYHRRYIFESGLSKSV